jgi:hypothetical protein
MSDPAKLKAHPYFSAIDWAQLEKKGVPPPYVPPNVGDAETDSMIDPDFLRQPINTPTQTDGALATAVVAGGAANVDGFTYVNEGALAAAHGKMH